ncbi:ABC transporter ATP-binding protein [Konateibacter massiliensis]|uniref:ABC transporter ATP-binding protein n=1 Tax=Konateibacter massiliensis TaxID=2002841 RepID=UPI000C14A4B8|nr:ABC transporter ATP-binding protein [Konateibacter massiliensis]
MKNLLKYIRPYYKIMLIGLIIKITATNFELALPWVLSYMIDYVIPQKSISKILVFGVIMLICTIGAAALNISANRRASKVARDVTETIRNDLFKKVAYLSNSQIDTVTLPSIIARLTTDTYNVHSLIGMGQRLGIRAPIMFVGGVALTLTLDPVLTLVMLSVLPLIVLVIIQVYKRAMPMYRELQRKIDRFVQVVREDSAGIRVIKALSKTEYEKTRFSVANEEVVKKEQQAGMTMGILNPSMNLFLNVGMVLVLLAGAYRVNTGFSTPGKIIAFMTYVTLILNAILFISRIFVTYSKAEASANRITEILNMEDELVKEEVPKENSEYHVEFDRVSFAYENMTRTLEDISFSLKRGETLGIIGATGSGKTAIINLLMRFYDVNQGTICIDGENIKSMELQELRKRFGIVFQNDILFNESIYENIRIGREIENSDLLRAAEYARAKEFIEDKEDGFEGSVSIKGANLSGGQKQRVLIARALAGKPEILILDDSSSALDYKTDAALRKEIRENFKDTTTILIAQRISSIRFADHILVLQDGRMAGYGVHEELLRDCSIYKEIYSSQMGGYENE